MFSILESASALGTALTSLIYRVVRIAVRPTQVTTFAPRSQGQVWLLLRLSGGAVAAAYSLLQRLVPMVVMFTESPLHL
jgi:hypothetical protein